ncbi:MAG: ATP-binding cassette domain-containing protein [Planctomycetes bacterium]|nr:ATP-binding cassette domain-containing protein [Planctomycetota bacterium]
MSDGAPLLACRDLAVGYGGRAVLREVSLAVRPGESWFLLGTNATGKSTLLHTLLGVLPPLAGRVERGAGFAPDRLGFVPQRVDFADLPTTPDELLRLGLVGQRLPLAVRESRIVAALADVGLAAQRHVDHGSLSGGQRQRLLVARALVRAPQLLCIDEPLAHLDLVTERALLELLARRQRDPAAALLCVTHQVAVAAHLATHIALVHHGRVDAGPRDTLLTPARLAEAYGAPVPVAAHPGLAGVRPLPPGLLGAVERAP